MNTKLLVIGVLGLLLVGCVNAITTYSNPIYKNGTSIDWGQPITISKPQCVKSEWNNKFDLFRVGDISKEDMKFYVRSCRW